MCIAFVRFHFFCLVIASCLFLANPNPTIAADIVEQSVPVAKVNGSDISREDFDRTFAKAQKQFAGIGYQQQGTAASTEVDLKNEVLDRLIDIELMLQDSQQRNIVLEEVELNNYLEGFKKPFKDDTAFNDFLQKNKITENDLQEQARRQLTIRKLQNTLQEEMTDKIQVKDEEIKSFYDANIERFKQQEQVKARHILVTVDQEADPEDKTKARETIEELKKKVTAGADFAELARTDSQGPSNARGGDLGFFSRGQMVKPFEDAVFKLQPGETSDIVETKFGYHLIRMEEKKEAEVAAYDDVRGDIEKYLRQSKLEQAQKGYIQGLRNTAEIKKF